MIFNNFFNSSGAVRMSFGSELKLRRKSKGFTQEGLAKAANNVCTGAYVSDLERGAYVGKKGRPTRPDEDIVIAIAKVLDWSPRLALVAAGHPDPGAIAPDPLDDFLFSGAEDLSEDDRERLRGIVQDARDSYIRRHREKQK